MEARGCDFVLCCCVMMSANQVVKLRRKELAACMTCPICNKLLRDATTVPECLHTCLLARCRVIWVFRCIEGGDFGSSLFPQSVFDHWEMMSSDPLEPGSQATALVASIRKRKGLKEQLTPLSEFEDKL
uniref:Putative translation elongation factor EFG, V domain-containing protein n=1 Tax=Helianthus annuus TaxID=4232 RepID=A0A251URX1_HELAN